MKPCDDDEVPKTLKQETNKYQMCVKPVNLGAEMALFGAPSEVHKLAHSFQHCW